MFGQPIILIVDDEPSNIEMLAAVLEDQYEVQFALNGHDALARLQQEPLPDLVLLDVVMPDLDGYQVCRAIKAEPLTQHIPVIFVTALSDPVAETRGFDAGAVDYVTKPISAPLVRARVRNHLEIRRTRDRLHHLALTDQLTHLANRRQFDQSLTTEMARAQRNGTPLSLLLIDLDEFKRYNDRYGQSAGDDCLRRVAAALTATVQRPADLVARLGGEEFACLLPNTDAAGAQQIGERIRQAVVDLAIEHAAAGTARVMTVSLGSATWRVDAFSAEQALYGAADAALYRAKHSGRNRVEMG